ncbi:MAG: 50S ribosomal protein L1 [Holophagales bacterium]|nr:50S ribosomal protein L1 [Holophagales bacterium]MXX60016.1 50S ribosomal protein L1 [Holophagales bacterium]MYC09841.1 50S ribosomal protein L1 [Holophagales bacterium]MYD21320.1 50S ribosomal protein L1 [Holophagales bacterium]MYI32574.1 50S ribosomal protein L1 [Holophagales bacterium]
MTSRGRNYKEARAAVEDRPHGLEEALQRIKDGSFAKFDETVEIAIRLGVNPRHADQMVRGTVVLPHGTGRTVRVLVFASGEKLQEAEAAGADHVGGEELASRIQDGWLDFDAVVATPDMMRVVGRLGRVLGPRGLMPNPKTGTVTPDVTKAIEDIKAGKVNFRVDKAGVVHAPLGKVSFDTARLVENATALLSEIMRARPSAAKGTYLRSVNLSSTMGPGVRVDSSEAAAVEAT